MSRLQEHMKIGCTRLEGAVTYFCFMLLVLAGPSNCAGKTSRSCAILQRDVSLHLACDPGQYITIDGVLVGSQASECRVNKECDSQPANISQMPRILACSGQENCNVTLRLLVTCNNTIELIYSVEILYRCFHSIPVSPHPISSEEFTTGSTMKPTEFESESTILPTEFMTGSTIVPTESMTGSSMKLVESTSGSTMSPSESMIGSTTSSTESITGSIISSTKSVTRSMKKPTESTPGSAVSPTESTTENTFLPTENTTGSRTTAAVYIVAILLVLLLGVMVITTLIVVGLLCVYRKPWKKDQFSSVSSNTCTHLNHASAPVANLYTDLDSGDGNVMRMSSVENPRQMTDVERWPPLTDRQAHSAVECVVSRVEQDRPGGSVNAQLDIPRCDSVDYGEEEFGKEDSFSVVHSHLNRDDVMLQVQTLQKTSDMHHAGMSPTDHTLQEVRTYGMGFAGSVTGDVFERSSVYETLSSFNPLSELRTDETYTTFLEQQELNVQPDVQRPNKNDYFEIEPLYLKNESKVAFDKLSYISEATEDPYNHLSRTELRLAFTTDCDLQELCERSDSTYCRHVEQKTVTEAEENNKSQDIRGRTRRNKRHEYFKLEADRFPLYKDAKVSPHHEALPDNIKHTIYRTSESDGGCG